MPGQDGERDRKLQLCGWLLFVLSAVFFIATSIRSGDMLALIGGLFFFAMHSVFDSVPSPEKAVNMVVKMAESMIEHGVV